MDRSVEVTASVVLLLQRGGWFPYGPFLATGAATALVMRAVRRVSSGELTECQAGWIELSAYVPFGEMKDNCQDRREGTRGLLCQNEASKE